jgi:hypothetical protein
VLHGQEFFLGHVGARQWQSHQNTRTPAGREDAWKKAGFDRPFLDPCTIKV